MEPGVVKVADDNDFSMLKMLVDDNSNWKLEYDKDDEIKVWTRMTPNSSFKMIKVQSVLQKVHVNTIYDVLHDPDYRKEWDEYMQASVEVGYLNPNNDIGYYAISCPAPVQNRDFVLQRSWLDMGNEKLILNHSVFHKNFPPKRDYVRAISHITGYVIRQTPAGCFIGYISQTDPKGKLPAWLMNKISQKFAPRIVKQLRKAAEGYESWKSTQRYPNYKPWIHPEQMLRSKKIYLSDCVLLSLSDASSHEEYDQPDLEK